MDTLPTFRPWLGDVGEEEVRLVQDENKKAIQGSRKQVNSGAAMCVKHAPFLEGLYPPENVFAFRLIGIAI